MCWNQYVSINTFVFGVFVLLFVALNNKYSNYKVLFFKNIYVYLFVLSIISMQFIEFILWRNLKNMKINHLFSVIGLLLLAIQPFCSLLLIDNISLRNMLLLIYTIPTIIYLIYNISITRIYTTISKCGHLQWEWIDHYIYNPIIVIFYLFFVCFSFIYNKQYIVFFFLFLFIALKYYYYKDKTASSLWCFYLNIIMIYFLFVVLLIKPFNEFYMSGQKRKCIL